MCSILFLIKCSQYECGTPSRNYLQEQIKDLNSPHLSLNIDLVWRGAVCTPVPALLVCQAVGFAEREWLRRANSMGIAVCWKKNKSLCRCCYMAQDRELTWLIQMGPCRRKAERGHGKWQTPLRRYLKTGECSHKPRTPGASRLFLQSSEGTITCWYSNFALVTVSLVFLNTLRVTSYCLKPPQL